MCLTIACEAFCCAGTSFCNLACCCCKWLVQSTLKEQIKLTYILTNYVIMTLTIIVLYYLQDFYINYLKYFGCPETIQSLCMGFSGIYRMSFVLTLFYFIILLFMFVKGTIAKMVNDGLWLLKFIIIAVCFYGTLYMSNSFFEKYITVCNVTSGFYQLFQVLIFIDIFYLWAEKWARMYDDGVEGMGSALVAAASITYTIAIILNIYNFIWFDHHYLIILLNVAVIIILTIVQMCGFNPSGSLIATGCIACYMTYQIYCALSSYPDANVNVFYDSSTNVTVQMFINGFLNFVALIYLIFATKEMSKQSLRVLDSNLDKREPKPVEIEMTHTQKVEEVKVLLEELELQPYNTNQFIAFHIIMIFCSMYMAMMITNWGSPTISGQSFQLFMPSELSYYVKLGTSGICSLLYLWSLIAPKVFPERFS